MPLLCTIIWLNFSILQWPVTKIWRPLFACCVWVSRHMPQNTHIQNEVNWLVHGIGLYLKAVNCYSTCAKIPPFKCNLKYATKFIKVSLVAIVRHFNPIHSFTTYFPQICFSTIPQRGFTGGPKYPLISRVTQACCMLCSHWTFHLFYTPTKLICSQLMMHAYIHTHIMRPIIIKNAFTDFM